VVITVNDESRKLKRDFKCKRVMLLNHMRYFEQYLKEDKSGDQLDISVHCDVKIFEWLMKYVDYFQNVAVYGNIIQLYKVNYQIVTTDNLPGTVNIRAPELDQKTCISIFISADFLKIEKLLKETSQYICNNLTEILALPIDMNCINDKLLRLLASTVTL